MFLRKFYIFFASITFVLSITVALNGYWVWKILLMLLLVRIICLRRKEILIFCFLVGILGIAYGNSIARYVQSKYFADESKISNQLIRIYSDEMNVDGDLVKATGYWYQGKQKVTLYYFVKSKHQADWLKKNINTQYWQVSGKIQAISQPTNENQFNYRKFQQSKKIYNSITATQIEKVDLKQENWQKLVARLHETRQKLILKFQKLPYPLSFYTQSLIVGKLDSDYEHTTDLINRLGLIYLFCLSGMHVFFIVKYLRILGQLLMMTVETTEWCILFILPILAIIGGTGFSLVRATAMVMVNISSKKMFQKQLSGLESWSLVLVGHVLSNPYIIYSMGAQLSYLLTFILLSSSSSNMWKLSLKMNAYSLPIILFNNYNFNWVTPIYSAIYGIIFEWIIFPITLIGMCFHTLGNQILRISHVILNISGSLNTTLTYGKPSIIIVIILLIILLSCENAYYYYSKIGLYLVILVFGYIVIHHPLKSEIVFFDVGQGDSILVRTLHNKQVTLIDTGGKVSFNKQKWQQRKSKTQGQTVIANYLLSKGINHIDNLVLSHKDMDHIGNFADLSQKINIRNIYYPQGMREVNTFNQLLKQSNCKHTKLQGVTTSLVPKISDMQVLHPSKVSKAENTDSITLYATLGNQSFVFTGDLDQAGEKEVLQEFQNLHADVLKLGHHGSKTSTSEEFLQQLRPKLAVISAGVKNRYGHPHPETLQKLNQQNIPYLLTARDGMIKIVCTKQGNIIHKYKEEINGCTTTN